jgi:hypothetical protein
MRNAMTRIMIDQATLAKLQNLRDKSEFVDEKGRPLGIFEPIPAPERALYDGLVVPFTEKELRLAEEETESYSTSEVLAYLETLPCSPSDGKG